MRVGIMQPYLFPYVGYFQLIHAVDAFILHDDVQYIKGGWIHRNRIQINNKAHLFTFSLKKDSSLKNINTRLFSDLFAKEKAHFLKLLHANYKKAPYFSDTYDLMVRIFESQESNVSRFITNSLQLLCASMHITTPIFISSQLEKNNSLHGQERVIDICGLLKADIYINPVGGTALYSKEIFTKNNIALYFLQTNESVGKVSHRNYIGNLSIIDIMMFHSKEKVRTMLNSYTLQ